MDLIYKPSQRWVALCWGVLCHLLFGVAVSLMMVSLFFGLTIGQGPFSGTAAFVSNFILAAQFGILHSLALSPKGQKWLGKVPLAGVGPELLTTTFAIIASVQIIVTFLFWSPTGKVWFVPEGNWLIAATLVYAASWLYLLNAMWNSGFALQTGFLGWWAVWNQRKVTYPGYAMRGPFRRSRQPIYLGFSLILWTAPTWTIDRLGLTLLWTAYCIVGPIFKEHRIRKFSTAGYRRYAASVPYWFPWPRKRWIDAGEEAEQEFDCDVVIVGGGPIGLTLASILGKVDYGVKVIESQNVSPADIAVVDTVSLEELESRLTSMNNVEISKGVGVDGIILEKAGMIVLDVGGKPVRARYAVSCDGRGSRMRRLVQMPVRHSESSVRFVMADFTDRSDLDMEDTLYFTRSGAVESFPLANQQRRWIFQTAVNDLDEPAILSQLKSCPDWAPDPADRVSDWTWFQSEPLLCDRFFHGRVIFCGDAAHSLDLVGGQGEELAFADVALAGESLCELLEGPPSLRILERYDRIRRRAFIRANIVTSFTIWINMRGGERTSNFRQRLISKLLIKHHT